MSKTAMKEVYYHLSGLGFLKTVIWGSLNVLMFCNAPSFPSEVDDDV